MGVGAPDHPLVFPNPYEPLCQNHPHTVIPAIQPVHTTAPDLRPGANSSPHWHVNARPFRFESRLWLTTMGRYADYGGMVGSSSGQNTRGRAVKKARGWPSFGMPGVIRGTASTVFTDASHVSQHRICVRIGARGRFCRGLIG
eukprot:gene9210-biopygen8246